MYKMILDIHKSLECKDSEKAQTQVDSLKESTRDEILCYCGNNHPFCSCDDKYKECGNSLFKGFCHDCELQRKKNIENRFLVEMYKMILDIHKSLACKDSEKAQTQVDSLEESVRNKILCYCGKIHE
jgi:transcriptional regulator of met regulon